MYASRDGHSAALQSLLADTRVNINIRNKVGALCSLDNMW